MRQNKPRDPAGGMNGKRWRTNGHADPNGNREQRRAWRRQQPKRGEARIMWEKSHVWNDATGICTVHGRECPRPA